MIIVAVSNEFVSSLMFIITCHFSAQAVELVVRRQSRADTTRNRSAADTAAELSSLQAKADRYSTATVHVHVLAVLCQDSGQVVA